MTRPPIKTGMSEEWKGRNMTWCISPNPGDHVWCKGVDCNCPCHKPAVCYHRTIVRGVNEAWCEDCNKGMPQYR